MVTQLQVHEIEESRRMGNEDLTAWVKRGLEKSAVLAQSGHDGEARNELARILPHAGVLAAVDLANIGAQCVKAGFLDEAHEFYRLARHYLPGSNEICLALFNTMPHWKRPIIGTSVKMEVWDVSHLDFLWYCFNQTDFLSRVGRHWRIPPTTDALKQILRRRTTLPIDAIGSMDWVICSERNKTWQPIGIIGLSDISYVHRRAEWYIGFPNHTLGLTRAATEASLLLLEFAFDHIGFERIVSLVYGNNPYAQKNSESLGFIREGVLRKHILDSATGKRIDVIMNACLKNDLDSCERNSSLFFRLLGRQRILKF